MPVVNGRFIQPWRVSSAVEEPVAPKKATAKKRRQRVPGKSVTSAALKPALGSDVGSASGAIEDVSDLGLGDE